MNILNIREKHIRIFLILAIGTWFAIGVSGEVRFIIVIYLAHWLPLFMNTKARMNSVSANTAPMIVQRQSVHFLSYSKVK